jgi:RNA polymerase sigma factor (sigma-70 family)
MRGALQRCGMPANRASLSAMPASHGAFQATQWSVVLDAAGDDSRAGVALAKLCNAYWRPLYAYARCTGLSPHDAEDATQGFFEHLLSRRALLKVDREKGRFRSFLLASVKNFLSHQREAAGAAKRGGGARIVELDAQEAEERYAIEPSHGESPDRLFDRQWARTVLDRAQSRLRAEYEAAGKLPLFEALRPALVSSRAAIAYAELGPLLGMSEGALKVAAHRLRERYRAVLRAEVQETVTAQADVDAELRHLIEAL